MRVGDTLIEYVDNSWPVRWASGADQSLCQQEWRKHIEPEMRLQRFKRHRLPIILPEHRRIVHQQIRCSAKMGCDCVDELGWVTGAKVKSESVPCALMGVQCRRQSISWRRIHVAHQSKGVTSARKPCRNLCAQPTLATCYNCKRRCCHLRPRDIVMPIASLSSAIASLTILTTMLLMRGSSAKRVSMI